MVIWNCTYPLSRLDSDNFNLTTYISIRYSSPHDPVPAKLNPPTFGTLVLFEVKPGVSFHAVQEVFRTKSPRLSVQGWFHASHPPKGVNSTSTLSDLTRRTNAQGFDSIPPKISPKVDDDSYLSRLSKYINQVYLQPDSVKKIREEFEENSTVHLYEFFNPSFVSVRTVLDLLFHVSIP